MTNELPPVTNHESIGEQLQFAYGTVGDATNHNEPCNNAGQLMIVFQRRSPTGRFGVFVVDTMGEASLLGNGSTSFAPLIADGQINFNQSLASQLTKNVEQPDSDDLFYYVYGSLWDRRYIAVYHHLLVENYPRVPIAASTEDWNLHVNAGRSLVDAHLMRRKYILNLELSNTDAEIKRLTFKEDRVFVNSTDFILGVTKPEWEFYIGSRRPLREYLSRRTILDSKCLAGFELAVASVRRTLEIQSSMELAA